MFAASQLFPEFFYSITSATAHPRLKGRCTSRSEQPGVPSTIQNNRHPKDRSKRLFLGLVPQHLLSDEATRPASNQ